MSREIDKLLVFSERQAKQIFLFVAYDPTSAGISNIRPNIQEQGSCVLGCINALMSHSIETIHTAICTRMCAYVIIEA